MDEHQPFASLEYRLEQQRKAIELRILNHPLTHQLFAVEGKTLEDVLEMILKRLDDLEERHVGRPDH